MFMFPLKNLARKGLINYGNVMLEGPQSWYVYLVYPNVWVLKLVKQFYAFSCATDFLFDNWRVGVVVVGYLGRAWSIHSSQL